MNIAATVVVAAGLWLGCLWDGPVWAAPVGLAVLAVAAVTAARCGARTAVALVALALMLVGAGLAGGRTLLRERSPLARVAERRPTAVIRGRVVTEPRATAFGAWALVRVTRIDGRPTATRGVLQLDGDTRIDVGQSVSGWVGVAPLPDGGFGRHLRILGAAGALRPRGDLTVGQAPTVLRQTTIVRDRARSVFATALDPERMALLSGLVLGTRDGIDDDTLRAAGLSHLVVVSGRHVAVVLAAVLAIAALGRLGHRGRHGLALLALWWFVVLTRWQPSVLRAAAVVTLVLVGALIGRGRAPLHALAMAVIVLLLGDPMLARRAGFALSVLAAGGVLIASHDDASASRGRVRLAVRMTIAAQVATAPVMLTMIGSVPMGAVPANLVAAPAAAVAQVLGLSAAALAAVDAPGAVVVARGAGPPIAVISWAAETFAALSQLTPLAAISGIALLVGAALVRHTTNCTWCHHAVAAAAIGWCAAVVCVPLLPARSPPYLRLVTVDVGQGDALLVEAPDGDDGARMIIDAGSTVDPLATALRSRRIRSIEVFVLTHGDHDHAGGLAALLRRIRVGTLAIPAGDPALRDASAGARAALRVARSAGVPIVELADGHRFRLGDAHVDVLAPPPRPAPGVERNGRSVVMRVEGAHGSMLLTGDADEAAQRRLLDDPSQLRADVVKVPHHGGATNAAGFIDAVGARAAVVSVGADNRYGHPHADTVADLAPVPLWRTDRHGTVTVSLTPEGPVVEHDRGR